MVDDPYREFEEALTEVLCEELFDLTRCRRLVRARERINRIAVPAVSHDLILALNSGSTGSEPLGPSHVAA